MSGGDWLSRPDEIGETPLTRVSRTGRMELANIMLVQEIEDQIRYVGYMPPIHRAAFFDFGDAIEDLLAEGADPTEENDSHETALHLAVRLGHVQAVKALMRSGMDVSMPSSLGMTPLHWAALNGNERIVNLLLSNGADPHAREWVAGGLTPIDMARIMDHKELADTLERGIDQGEE